MRLPGQETYPNLLVGQVAFNVAFPGAPSRLFDRQSIPALFAVRPTSRVGLPLGGSVQPHGTVVMRQTVRVALPVVGMGQGVRALEDDHAPPVWPKSPSR